MHPWKASSISTRKGVYKLDKSNDVKAVHQEKKSLIDVTLNVIKKLSTVSKEVQLANILFNCSALLKLALPKLTYSNPVHYTIEKHAFVT